jgi:hypothetical protein
MQLVARIGLVAQGWGRGGPPKRELGSVGRILSRREQAVRLLTDVALR